MAELLGIEEACKLLDLTKYTIYKYARSGAIPACKMGSLWKFDKESLDKWIKEKIKEDTKTRFEKKFKTAKIGK